MTAVLNPLQLGTFFRSYPWTQLNKYCIFLESELKPLFSRQLELHWKGSPWWELTVSHKSSPHEVSFGMANPGKEYADKCNLITHARWPKIQQFVLDLHFFFFNPQRVKIKYKAYLQNKIFIENAEVRISILGVIQAGSFILTLISG